MARQASQTGAVRAPASYGADPVGFTRDVLGFAPWRGQETILRAVAEHDRVACVSGHGVGKSSVAGAVALWFWATSGPNARVIMLSPSYRQTNETLYSEVKKHLRTAKSPLPATVGHHVSTGVRSNDGRELFGVSPDSPVSLQGIRAPKMLVIVDESSGVTDEMFDAVMSLLSGGGKLLLLGNPLRTMAPFSFFFRSYRSGDFCNLRIASIDSPNVVENRIVIPGLVTAAWCENRASEYGGTDTALFRMKVLGEFVEGVEGRLFPPEMLMASTARWAATLPTGRLVLGVDPAGASGKGDSSAFVARREMKVIEAYTRTGLSEDAHVAEILGLCAKHGGGDGLPLVCVDRDGHVGARVYTALNTYQMQHDGVFQLRGIRGGEKARLSKVYHLQRHELYYLLVDAFKAGLAIPDNARLLGELSVIKSEVHRSGLSMVQHKDDLRKELNGRSPDLADALALTCAVRASDGYAWESTPDRDASAQGFDPYSNTIEPHHGVDPYNALDAWGPR
jgi:hypothetical protein